jgi:hypothetical protein|nr:MAG TPA: DNA-directed RNA polymerase subunit beta' [Caudoviricetes sp.]
MKNEVMENVWNKVNELGLPLIAQFSPKLFVDDYWDIGKLETRVTVTYKGVKIAKMKFAKAIMNWLLFTTLDKHHILDGQEDRLEDFIFTGSGNVDSQNEYVEMVKDECFNRMNMKFFDVAFIVGEIKEAFVQFAWVVDNKKMIDISMLDIFELCDADETLKDWIINGPVKRDDMSLFEVEELKKHTLDYISKVVEEKDIQPLRSLVKAGTGLRLAQFVDCLFMIGSRPDQDEVIPNIEKESWLRGISTPESFYYESYISRCATIITKLEIKDPGAFQKTISYLNNPNYLNPNPDYMCDSKAYVEYFVESQEVLNKLNDRYMIHDSNHPRDVELITKDRTDLIGKTIKVRSPFTCNSKEGICRYCTGEHTYFDNVKGPLGANMNLGVQFVKQYIAPEGQNYLSSKHNMITIIENIIFRHDDTIDVQVKHTDIIYCNGTIVINEKYRIDDPRKDSQRVCYNGFDVEVNGMVYPVETDGVLELRDDNFLHVVYKNKRKSKVYNEIKAIFENPAKFKDPVAELNRLLKSPYIVGETVLKNCLFVTNKDKEMYKPDWSRDLRDDESYTFVGYKKGIVNNTGIVNKLCYGYFDEVMTSPDNFKPVSHMNYDVLYADRSNHEAYKKAYEEKYKKEIEEDNKKNGGNRNE